MKKLRLVLIVCLSLFATVVLAQDGNLLVGDIAGDAAAYYGQQVTVQGNVDELVNIRSFLLGEGGLTNPQLLVLNNSGQEFNIGLTAGAQVVVTGTVYPSYAEGGWDQVMSAGMGGQAAGQPEGAGAEVTVTEAVEGAEAMVTEVAEGAEAMATEAVEGAEAMATEAVGGEGEAMATATPVQEGAGEGAGMGGGVGLGEYPVVILSDRFPEHTLLVVDSIDNIQFVETEE